MCVAMLQHRQLSHNSGGLHPVRSALVSVSFNSIKHRQESRPRPHAEANKAPSPLRARWLSLAVHCDAFRLDWLGYCQAVFWRVRGLRLRSRNRLASLMGRSPHAYRLWIARSEASIRAALLDRWKPGCATILPVVDCPGGARVTELTLRSLTCQGNGAPFVIANGDANNADYMRLVRDLDSQGQWICIVSAGDQLDPGSLELYSRSAARWPERWVIYADDDLLQEGERTSPHFKTSWNPDLFDHHDFVTGSAIIRVTPEMFADLGTNDWAKELTHRAIGRGAPVHIPAVLHHRLVRPNPVIPDKPTPSTVDGSPLVSVIVPTRNRLPLLRTCIEGVSRTAYPKVQLIVVDNDSDDPETLAYLHDVRQSGATVLNVAGAFNFSALNNAAVEHADGEFLCFLNNDIEIRDPDWLSLLVRQACRREIGAVGARLVYPDGAVQHAGVVIGVGGGAAHAHRFQRDTDDGYFLRDRLPQRVTAVTAACLVLASEKFRAVGGFNEEDFPVAFNDVDLCLKLNGQGWQSFYEPRAVLVHHESKSRGSDSAKENRARFAAELGALKRIWGTDRIRDPYHHPQLSPFTEQFHIAV
jgi:O-antigen biosynthesis protein